MIVKKAFKRHNQVIRTWVIVHTISPDYDVEHEIEKTGTYSYIRAVALSMACSGHCIILDIYDKEKGRSDRKPDVQ